MPINSEIISCGDKSLPRSLDVFVSVDKVQTEQATDLSVLVFVAKNGPLPHGAGRIQYYQDVDGVENVFGLDSEAWKAARDFFSQRKRSKTLAIAQAFDDPQAGFMKTGAVDVAATIAVADGEFSISIDGVTYEAVGMDFTGETDIEGIALVVQTTLDVLIAGTKVIASGTQLLITSSSTGNTSAVSVMGPPAVIAGTDVSGTEFLNGAAGKPVPGYAPTGFLNELSLIEEAARCAGLFVYGWGLDAGYRDSSDASDAAAWMEARTGVLGLTSNDPFAWDAGSVSDIGSVLQPFGYTRTIDPIFHDNVNYYPEISLLARMLGVDYAGENTAITAKFKDLPGIPTVGLDVTQWTTLNSKGYNSFTLTGNNSRFVREGGQVNESWWLDDRINLDNFVEELQVAVMNAYIRNGKIPLTPTGETIKRDAIVGVCERYDLNGSFEDREVADPDEKSGFSTIPAYEIIFAPLSGQTDSDRASRIGPPATVNVQLEGADHSMSINVLARD